MDRVVRRTNIYSHGSVLDTYRYVLFWWQDGTVLNDLDIILYIGVEQHFPSTHHFTLRSVNPPFHRALCQPTISPCTLVNPPFHRALCQPTISPCSLSTHHFTVHSVNPPFHRALCQPTISPCTLSTHHFTVHSVLHTILHDKRARSPTYYEPKYYKLFKAYVGSGSCR